jgi:hypothetical protein
MPEAHSRSCPDPESHADIEYACTQVWEPWSALAGWFNEPAAYVFPFDNEGFQSLVEAMFCPSFSQHRRL